MNNLKKLTALVVSVLMLMSGCGQKAAKDENISEKVSSETVSETSDVSSTPSSKKATASDTTSVSSKKSDVSSKSKDTSSKHEKKSSSSSSNSSTSSKRQSDTDKKKSVSSKSSVSSASAQQGTTGEPITYTYEIGAADDPIRNVAPEEVQKYIVEEPTIVTEPEPEAVFINDYEDVPEKEKVPDSWFDDCVFMGDSLSVGLSMYNDANGVFGDAKFVCASSLSYWNSQWDLYRPGNVHPYYKGQKVLLEDAVNLTGAKKAIITLGMNDIGIWGPAGVIDHTRSLLNKIRAKSPDVKIYFQTVSPMIYYAQKTHLNNYLIRQFNSNLEQFAAEEGCGFLNSYEALSDSNGNLPYDFCSDPGGLGLHLKFNGCAVWAEFIKANIGSAYPEPEPEPESDSDSVIDTSSEEKTETDSESVAVDDTEIESVQPEDPPSEDAQQPDNTDQTEE